jgi:hypothetical protein
MLLLMLMLAGIDLILEGIESTDSR